MTTPDEWSNTTAEPRAPAVPREMWSDYWRRQHAEAGVTCPDCGCPLGWHTKVEGKSPNMVIIDGFRCLFCGRDY